MRTAWRTLALLPIASSIAACTLEDNPISGPSLLVQRYDEAGRCYVTCEGQSDSTAQLPDDTCTGATSAACGFAGGEDRIRIIADYGDVRVDPQKRLTPPVLTLIADGAELAAKPSFLPRAPGTDEGRFDATFIAPALQIGNLAMRVATETGFGATTVPRFSVAKPVVELRFEGCSKKATCERPAGVGRPAVTVVAPQGFAGQQATISTFVNGVAQATSTLTLGQPVLDTETSASVALVTGSFDAPIDPNALWKLSARVGAYASDDCTVHLTPPVLTLSAGNCPEPGACTCLDSGPCERKAGVGRLEVVVSAPKDLLNKKGTVVATVNEVIRQTNEVTLDAATGKVSTFFDTPPDESADWKLVARFDASESDKLWIKLVPPGMDIQVPACPSTDQACSLPAKSSASVKVTAPKGILDKEATITWTVGGLPSGVATPVSLSDLEVDPKTGETLRAGVVPIPVPDEVGKPWQLKALIGESVKLTPIITISPAAP